MSLKVGDRVRVKGCPIEAEIVELMHSYAARLDRTIGGFSWYNINDLELIEIEAEQHWHECVYCEVTQACSGSCVPQSYYFECPDCELGTDEPWTEQSNKPDDVILESLTRVYLSEKLAEGDSLHAHGMGVSLS